MLMSNHPLIVDAADLIAFITKQMIISFTLYICSA